MKVRASAVVGGLALGVAAVVAVLVGLAIGGGADAPTLLDPGPLVRYGAPISDLAVNLAAAGTLGALVMAALAIPPGTAAFERTMTLAAVSSGAWTLAGIASTLFSYAQAIGSELRLDDTFGIGLWTFVTDTELGQSRFWSTVLAAVVALIVTVTRNLWFIALSAVLAAGALVPLAGIAHAGGTPNHNLAWGALALHLLFAAIWLGGLVVLVVARSDDPKALATRFSSIALVSFLVVGGSGLISGWIRVGADGLGSPYATLLLIKIVAFALLGVVGALHRLWAIRRLPSTRHFLSLVIGELVLMGVAGGMAAALGVTEPAVSLDVVGTTPADLLTGEPLPPAPTAERYLFGFDPDPVWLAITIAGIAYYLAGVRRLARRGDRWSWLRTASWILGMLALAWSTSGGIAPYVDTLFSGHMLAHMTIGMVVPVLLVPGAPITLAMRAIQPRKDGSRGPREWLLAIVHSGYIRVVGNPYIASVIFVGSLWIFYFTPVFRWATTTHYGHEWMIIHFLLSGYLFTQALIGIDPAPSRPPYAVRLLLLLATMALHAFFGLAIMTGEGLMLADWFGAMGWDYGVTALEDQQRAGGIAWSVGEIPTVALAIIVSVQWASSDEREQRRRDRQADRDGDAELEAYNEMLAAQARSDRD